MARILSDETSLTRRKKRLQSESAYLHRLVAIEAIVAGVCLLAGTVLYVLKDSQALLWIGGAMGLLALGHWIKVHQNRQDSQSLGVGIEGEAEVTRRLAEYLDQRHYLFNDLLIKHGRRSAQIDHVVVGPGGLFVIETKNWGGTIKGFAEDQVWHQEKRNLSRVVTLRNPVLQNRDHAEILSKVMESYGIHWPDLVSVLVNRNPRARFLIEGMQIPVLEPGEACEWIAGYRGEKTYSDEDIDEVVALLQKVSRT